MLVESTGMVPVPVSVPGKRFRLFMFRFRFLGKISASTPCRLSINSCVFDPVQVHESVIDGKWLKRTEGD